MDGLKRGSAAIVGVAESTLAKWRTECPSST